MGPLEEVLRAAALARAARRIVSGLRRPGDIAGDEPSAETARRLQDLATLGLEARANRDDIEAAFRRLAKQHHPDRFHGQGAEAVAAANRAFMVLRAAYERLVRDCGGAR